MKQIGEGTEFTFDFTKTKKVNKKVKADVVPVVVQDIKTGKVLITAYVNQEALKYSLDNKVATFWSTSRNELWVKGSTSGSMLRLIEARVNCDQNSLLYLVEPVQGCGACHTKDAAGKYRKSCYYRRLSDDGKNLIFIND